MTDDAKRQLRQEALGELYEACADERAHAARARKLIDQMRQIAEAHQSEQLRTSENNKAPAFSVGGTQLVRLPEPTVLYEAMLTLERAQQRVTKARAECKELQVDPTSMVKADD